MTGTIHLYINDQLLSDRSFDRGWKIKKIISDWQRTFDFDSGEVVVVVKQD